MSNLILPSAVDKLWTPTIQDSSLSDAEGQTYVYQNGYSTKIGNRVFIHGRLQLTSKGTLAASDPVRLAGLPYTSGAVGETAGGIQVYWGQLFNAIGAGANVTGETANSTNFILNLWDGAGGEDRLLVSQLTNTSRIFFTGQYITNSP